MHYLIIGNGAREYAIAKRLIAEKHQVSGIGTKDNCGLSNICKNYHKTRELQ